MSAELNTSFASLITALANLLTYLGPAIAGAIGYHYATNNGAKIATAAANGSAAEPPKTPSA